MKGYSKYLRTFGGGIRDSSMSVQRFTKYRIKLVLNSIWALPAVFFIRILRPIVRIQICKIFSERIGHFTPDIAEHICRENFRDARTLNLYYFGMISNKQWEVMARRSNLIILGRWVRYIDKWNQLIPGGDAHVLNSSLTQSRDIEGLFVRYDGSISFLEEENRLGKEYLESKGWRAGEPFVCLLVRDSKFLKSNLVVDGSHHNYRDSNINTYVSSMEWLASQGVWVLRMGKLMERSFPTQSNRIIDYAFDSSKSDFLDIWLFANCDGVISTATGLDYLAAIYRKPQLYLNALPLGHLHSWSDMIWVPKNLKWKKTGISLSISEHLQHDYYSSDQYGDAGIEVVDLSSKEIDAAIAEFWAKICGSWQDNPHNADLQENFWKVFMDWPQYDEMHGFRHSSAVVGSGWLANLSDDSLK